MIFQQRGLILMLAIKKMVDRLMCARVSHDDICYFIKKIENLNH